VLTLTDFPAFQASLPYLLHRNLLNTTIDSLPPAEWFIRSNESVSIVVEMNGEGTKCKESSPMRSTFKTYFGETGRKTNERSAASARLVDSQ
jgi:hypothetical protein